MTYQAIYPLILPGVYDDLIKHLKAQWPKVESWEEVEYLVEQMRLLKHGKCRAMLDRAIWEQQGEQAVLEGEKAMLKTKTKTLRRKILAIDIGRSKMRDELQEIFTLALDIADELDEHDDVANMEKRQYEYLQDFTRKNDEMFVKKMNEFQDFQKRQKDMLAAFDQKLEEK